MTDLKRVIADSLRLTPDAVADDAAMETLESWDSLAHMDLIANIETVFGLTLTADDIITMTSLPAIRTLLSTRGVAL